MRNTHKFLIGFIVSIIVLGQLVLLPRLVVQAATLTSGSASISDSRPDETSVTYDLQFSNVTTSAIQCISVVFSTLASGGSVPPGMDTTGSSFSGSSDYIPTPGSWVLDGTANGTVLLRYGTGETPAATSDRNVILTGITNGSTSDVGYFVQFNTYNNTDCSSSAVDTGSTMFIYTEGQAVSVTVDPSIAFSIAGVGSSQAVNGATTNVATTSTTIPLGTVTSSTNQIGAQDLTITTNAANGYTVYTRYTAILTNGASDTITDHTGTNASPTSFPAAGTEAFGYTTNDATLGTGTADRFTNPGNEWAAFTTSNLEVAYDAGAVSSQTTRVGYQVGIAGTTEAGTYTSTVIHTATPTY